MAKKNGGLSREELIFIAQRESVIASIIGVVAEAAKFKKGDFLIAYRPATCWQLRVQLTNSYGAPKKFIVVHTDKYDLPCIKEVSKNGNPSGPLILTIKFENGNRAVKSTDHEFEVDPDYTDAIIMADEENYDATIMHKAKSSLFKEITNHNKSVKVDCNDVKVLVQYLQTLKVGDLIYKSIKSYFTIQTLDAIPTSHNFTRIIEHKAFGTALTSKGKTIDIDSRTFKWSAIYTSRPRSYNELKDLK